MRYPSHYNLLIIAKILIGDYYNKCYLYIRYKILVVKECGESPQMSEMTVSIGIYSMWLTTIILFKTSVKSQYDWDCCVLTNTITPLLTSSHSIHKFISLQIYSFYIHIILILM